MNTSDLTVSILEGLGGIENIQSMSNCKTRIRVEVNDIEKVNQADLKLIYGIIGVVPFGSQIQIILGQKTEEIAKVFFNKLKIKNGNK
ncbi:PTS glucose/sucrose transporter subunit IIB [Helcococcus ovis]|uniref:PTS transporter subunit EIIB n=1 Tax=Helcococcus ovis TaxID=72026 RepID=UPI0038B8D062